MADLFLLMEANRIPRWEDFTGLQLVGEGGFGKVWKCTDVATSQWRAIKECNKAWLIANRQEGTAMRELRVLKRMNSPWIIKLFGTWHDELSLYFVMEYMPNGDLFDLVNKFGPLPVDLVRHYTAELALGLEYLEDMNVVHRDLKPENILLDFEFHVKICDFGCAQVMANRQAYSRAAIPGGERMFFAGTWMYMAPEILRRERLSYGPDRWAYGCIVFFMLTSLDAFPHEPTESWAYRVTNCIYQGYPRDYSDPDCKDFCGKIFKMFPEDRLGARGIVELKAHRFVNSLDWDNLKEIYPPIPFFARRRDVGNQPFFRAVNRPPMRPRTDNDKYSVPPGSYGHEFLMSGPKTPPIPEQFEDAEEDRQPQPRQPAQGGYREPQPEPGCLDMMFGGAGGGKYFNR